MGHDPRLQRHDDDRRHRAARLRLGAGARLRRRPCARDPDFDVLRGIRVARHRRADLRRPQEARPHFRRPGLASGAGGVGAGQVLSGARIRCTATHPNPPR